MPRAILILVLLLVGAGRAQAPERYESLVMHGTREGQFLAVVERVPKSDGSSLPVSIVRFRKLGGGPEAWAEYAKFDARVMALAERGGDLAVLLEVAESGPGHTQLRYVHNSLERASRAVDVGGTSLPTGVTALDIAGGSGEAPMLVLGRLGDSAAVWALAGTQWQELAPLPAEVSQLGDASLDLGSHGRQALVAARTSGGGVLVLEQSQDAWRELGRVEVAGEDHFQLVGGGPDMPVMLYVFGAGDRIVQFPRGDSGSDEAVAARSVDVEYSPPESLNARLDPQDPRTAGVAIGSVRLLRATTAQTKADTGGPVLIERALNPASLEPVGDEAVVLSFSSMSAEMREQVVTLLLYSLLVIAVVAVLRQRPLPPAERMREVAQQLAPLGPRFLAGLIDGVPLALAAVTWWLLEDRLGSTGQWMIAVGGILFYLAHLMAAEAATGRSLGKAFFGLKVVRTDGGEAGPGAILLRNVLRPLDVPTAGLGLAWLNPLRQRLGDIAAGTTVIRTQANSGA